MEVLSHVSSFLLSYPNVISFCRTSTLIDDVDDNSLTGRRKVQQTQQPLSEETSTNSSPTTSATADSRSLTTGHSSLSSEDKTLHMVTIPPDESTTLARDLSSVSNNLIAKENVNSKPLIASCGVELEKDATYYTDPTKQFDNQNGDDPISRLSTSDLSPKESSKFVPFDKTHEDEENYAASDGGTKYQDITILPTKYFSPKLALAHAPTIRPSKTPSSCVVHRALPLANDVVGCVAQRYYAQASACVVTPSEVHSPSCYHSTSAPPILLDTYLRRLQSICRITEESFILGAIYANRITIRHRIPLNVFTVHRLALICTVLAAKFFEDIFYSNSCYAATGGVSLKELNSLELYTLHLLNFKLLVDPQTYFKWYNLYTQETKFDISFCKCHQLSRISLSA